MSTTEANSSSNAPTVPKRSRAAIKLAAIQEKEADLKQQRVAAEAAVAEEKRHALVTQGLSDFLGFLAQREPGEIEGIVATAIPSEAPVEKVESVRFWTDSLMAAASARRD